MCGGEADGMGGGVGREGEVNYRSQGRAHLHVVRETRDPECAMTWTYDNLDVRGLERTASWICDNLDVR